ncbi:unnamed protein product [Meganyctiphanes norvegica]|uniref:C2H2-type domain-containing protein n=1 Tax=Meganyctiphanes norvegica TaxID=48144 RepID=A0AAV2RH95_MEGNR
MAYGENEELLPLDTDTDDTNICKSSTYYENNEVQLLYSKRKLLGRKGIKCEELPNKEMMSKKKKINISNEESMSVDAPGNIKDTSLKFHEKQDGTSKLNHTSITIIQDETQEISVSDSCKTNTLDYDSENNIQINGYITFNDIKRLAKMSYSQNNTSNKNIDKSNHTKFADNDKTYTKGPKLDLIKMYANALPKSFYFTSLQNNTKLKKKCKEKASCSFKHSKVNSEKISNVILNSSFICKMCKNKFRTEELLNEHMDAHRSNKYYCSQCGQQFSKMIEIAMHMHMHAHSEKWRNRNRKSGKKSDNSTNKPKSVSFSDEIQIPCNSGVCNVKNTFEQENTSKIGNDILMPDRFQTLNMNTWPVRQTDKSKEVEKQEIENNSINTENNSDNQTRNIQAESAQNEKEYRKFQCRMCIFSCDKYKSLLEHRHTHSKEYQYRINNASITNTINENNHKLLEISNSSKIKFESKSKPCRKSKKHNNCKINKRYHTSHNISENKHTLENVDTKEPCGLPLVNEDMNMSNGNMEEFNHLNSKLNNENLIRNLSESVIKHTKSKENEAIKSFVDTEASQSHAKSIISAEKNNKILNSRGETKLIRACILNKEEEVKNLLSLPGIDINKADHAGWTALHEAAIRGYTVIVKLLLDFQPRASDGSYMSNGFCDVTKQGMNGMTALHDAVSESNTEVVKLLLEYGGNTLLKIKNSSSKLASDITKDAQILNLLKSFEGTKGVIFEKYCD